MKASVAPIPNAFQTYLRTLILDHAAVSPLGPTICSNCLTRRRRFSHNSSRRKLLQRSYTTHASRTSTLQLPARGHRLQHQHQHQTRQLATVTNLAKHGPLEEYDDRVHSRKLRDDEHQRSQSVPVATRPQLTLLQLWSNTSKTSTTV